MCDSSGRNFKKSGGKTMNKDYVCARCQNYLGFVEDLEECPVCGESIIKGDMSEEE